MDGASLPIAIFIYLISAGFVVATFAAVTVGGVAIGRYGDSPKPIDGDPAELTKYDKAARFLLWTLWVILAVLGLAVSWGIVSPTPGYAWLADADVGLTLWPLAFAAAQLRDDPEGIGHRDLLRRRLWGIGLTAVAVLYFALTVEGII